MPADKGKATSNGKVKSSKRKLKSTASTLSAKPSIPVRPFREVFDHEDLARKPGPRHRIKGPGRGASTRQGAKNWFDATVGNYHTGRFGLTMWGIESDAPAGGWPAGSVQACQSKVAATLPNGDRALLIAPLPLFLRYVPGKGNPSEEQKEALRSRAIQMAQDLERSGLPDQVDPHAWYLLAKRTEEQEEAGGHLDEGGELDEDGTADAGQASAAVGDSQGTATPVDNFAASSTDAQNSAPLATSQTGAAQWGPDRRAAAEVPYGLGWIYPPASEMPQPALATTDAENDAAQLGYRGAQLDASLQTSPKRESFSLEPHSNSFMDELEPLPRPDIRPSGYNGLSLVSPHMIPAQYPPQHEIAAAASSSRVKLEDVAVWPAAAYPAAPQAPHLGLDNGSTNEQIFGTAPHTQLAPQLTTADFGSLVQDSQPFAMNPDLNESFDVANGYTFPPPPNLAPPIPALSDYTPSQDSSLASSLFADPNPSVPPPVPQMSNEEWAAILADPQFRDAFLAAAEALPSASGTAGPTGVPPSTNQNI